MVPLQPSIGDVVLQTVVFWSLALATLALALAITVIAFRGYRRNDSRPMLFIAVGFGVIFLPQALLVPLMAVVTLDEFAVETAVQLANFVGLGCILYAITMDPDR